MKFLMILIFVLLKANIFAFKPVSSNNENCRFKMSNLESKNLMKLYLRMPHRFIANPNFDQLLCLINKDLYKKQRIKKAIKVQEFQPIFDI